MLLSLTLVGACGGDDGAAVAPPAEPQSTRAVPSVVEPPLPTLPVEPAPDGDGDRVVLRERALFEFDSAVVTAAGEATLDAARRTLEPTTGPVTVIGHTDTCGTEAYNLDLSRQRAQAVVDGLVARGFPADRLRPDGVGEAGAVGPTQPCNQPSQRYVEVRFG